MRREFREARRGLGKEGEGEGKRGDGEGEEWRGGGEGEEGEDGGAPPRRQLKERYSIPVYQPIGIQVLSQSPVI